MPDPPCHAAGSPAPAPSAVLRPPRVSVREGMVLVDVGAARRALDRLPPAVGRVALSAGAGSPAEENAMLEAMDAALREGGEAAVCVRPFSEAVKVVRDGQVAGSLDRSTLVSVAAPVLFDREALAALVTAGACGEWTDPVRALLDAGGRVRVVSSPI